MALKSIYTNAKTKRNVHSQGVGRFRTAVGETQFAAIDDWLMNLFDQQEWVNTTFVAPEEWQGTPLEIIWEFNFNIPDFEERHRQSAILYGCVVYTILFSKPETYFFHRHEGLHSDDTTPYGLTYRRE